ncbi:unnamed protein product [Leuciscus chuanchicus]
MLPMSPVPLLSLLLLALQIVWSSTPQEPKVQGSPQPEISSLHHPTWSLGLQLYRSIRIGASKTNTIISPLLLANSLLALGGGANGSTVAQFHDLLRITQNEKAVGEALTRALKSVREANGTSYTLHSSSALFSKHAPELEKSFLEKLQTHFGLQHVALEDAQKETDMEMLQSWAKSGMDGEETAALEQALETKPGAVILANALRFKGFWDRGFHESQELRNFLGTKYTKVPMMHRTGVYRHYEDMENMLQVLELGLWEGKASMVLLLPFHVEGLARLDRLLTLDQVEKWLGKLNSTSMALSLPRAKMSSAINLKKQLATLGLVDACNETSADFSTASSMGRGKLHLGAVLHWTSLELAPESGSIDGMHEDEDVEKPKTFYADHSFIILVRDNSTGALLMIGALDHTDSSAIHDEL